MCNKFSSPGGTVASVTAPGVVEFSGTITQFGFTVVPEPASYALALCGLGALALLRRRKSS